MNMKIRAYENTHMNNRANLYYHVLIQVNMMSILNVTNSLRWVQRPVEGAKQLFQKEWGLYIYSGAIKIKYKKLFPRLWTLQTSAEAIVWFDNIKEHGEIESHGKLFEREFMVPDKCYKEYNRLPKDETVRYLKFLIKNVNTTYYFFTIRA